MHACTANAKNFWGGFFSDFKVTSACNKEDEIHNQSLHGISLVALVSFFSLQINALQRSVSSFTARYKQSLKENCQVQNQKVFCGYLFPVATYFHRAVKRHAEIVLQ